MGLFDTLLGVGKLAANVLGGGSGKKESTDASQNTSQNTSQSSTQNSSSSSSANTQASRREFSDGFLSLLETSAANSVVGGSQGTDALNRQLKKVQQADLTQNPIQFDAEAFIRNSMAGVDNSLGTTLRQSRNKATAAAGGSAAGNSASALLANRLEAENAAQRAGILGSTTAQAKSIEAAARASNNEALATETTLLSGLDTSMQSGLATLLNALRGGETFQEVNNKESQVQSQSSTATGTATGITTGNSSTRTPFNWTAGLGNLFKDVNQD